MSASSHNDAILPILRLITAAEPHEAGQWVMAETICLAIGELHRRSPRQTAEFVDAVASRIASGERGVRGG